MSENTSGFVVADAPFIHEAFQAATAAQAVRSARAMIVRERNDAYDMQSGPHGFERVGFAIGERVFWVGCIGSHMASSDYAADEALARTIVERWNAGL